MHIVSAKKDRQGFSLCIPAGSVVSALSALSPEAVDWSKVPRGPKRVGLGPKKNRVSWDFHGISHDLTIWTHGIFMGLNHET